MTINYDALTAIMPFKWKVQTASDYNCMCVAYVDSRQVQDKLDSVVGPMNWQDRYKYIDGDLFCEIGIWDEEKKDWVWKGDCGTESMTEKEKGQASDAFKRAAVKWGVGRFLYSMEIQKIKSGKDNRGKNCPVDEAGKQIWDVTKYINDRLGKNSVSVEVKKTIEKSKVDSYSPSTERYNADKGGAETVYKTVSLSSETMERVRGLNRDGVTGSEVLKNYLGRYNITNKTTLTAKDLKTNELVVSVLDFIDNCAPVI